jgi:uncharacterized membrane protein
MMDDLTLARAIHIVSVIAWIGGVYMVTMIVLPLVHQQSSLEDKIKIFQGIEKRFGAQARFYVLAAGLSGFYMVDSLDAWDRFASIDYWWMHAMTIIWLLFSIALYILEPFVLHKWFHKRVVVAPDKSFRLVGKVHYVLLTASIITVIGAIYGVHG